MLLALNTKRGKGACWSSGMGLGRETNFSYFLKLALSEPTSWLIHILEHPWCYDNPHAILDSQDSPRPGLGGSHHLPPYNILCVTPRHLHLNGFLSRDSQGGVSKLSRFGLLGFCEFITICSDLWLGCGLKQTSNSPWELSNNVLHSTCTHQGRVDSQLLVVGSQIVNLTLDLSSCHNLCFKCPNDSCKAIFDIYTSIAFQWHEERLKARCFDPCNWALKFWESWRTPKSPFWECECHPHILPKVGLQHHV